MTTPMLYANLLFFILFLMIIGGWMNTLKSLAELEKRIIKLERKTNAKK